MFISERKLWRFDSLEETNQHFSSPFIRMDPNYPKSLGDEFRGLTADIDSATTDNGMLF